MLLCWAANFIFAKIATRELPALLTACLRTALAGVFMGPIYLWARNKPAFAGRKWNWKDAPKLLTLGVLGLVGIQIVFVLAISRTSVAHSALIMATAPIFVLLGAAWLRHEHLSKSRLCGMALAAAGVALLQLGHAPSGHSSLTGDIIMLISAMMFAAFTVFGKGMAREFGMITINAFAFIGGALAVLPYTVWQLAMHRPNRVSTEAWLSVLYMGFFPSIVGYLIYAYALRHMPASRVSSVSYLQPVCATFLAVIFLSEQPGSAFAGGAALILSGVWITQRTGTSVATPEATALDGTV